MQFHRVQEAAELAGPTAVDRPCLQRRYVENTPAQQGIVAQRGKLKAGGDSDRTVQIESFVWQVLWWDRVQLEHGRAGGQQHECGQQGQGGVGGRAAKPCAPIASSVFGRLRLRLVDGIVPSRAIG